MFPEIMYSIICIGYIILFAGTFYLLKKKLTYHLILFSILIVGLFYDGLIIGIGNLIGPGELLKFISWPRFLFHATMTPFCVIIVFELMVEYGIIGEKYKVSTQREIIGIIYMSLLLVGLFTHFIGIQLDTTESGGIMRYTQVYPEIPPIATIIVSTLLLIMGIKFGIRTKWKVPWIFVGTMIIFFGSMVPQSRFGPVLSSSVELVLTLSMIVVYNIIYKKENISITSPVSSDIWTTNSTTKITWTPSTTISNVSLELWSESRWVKDILVNIANTGSTSWKIPEKISSGYYHIRIKNSLNRAMNGRSEDFKIEQKLVKDVLSITEHQ